MTHLEILVEGVSDVPVIREILQRKFQLIEGRDFHIHPHSGKGSIPTDPLAKVAPQRLGLLDQLPAKLRVYAKSPRQDFVVIVVVDVDNTPCVDLLKDLKIMLGVLPEKPNVIFRLAIDELESWFISDVNALRSAYPGRVKKATLKNTVPDQVAGSWELLARSLGFDESSAGPGVKLEWATKISPHLNLDNPRSPSLQKFIDGVKKALTPP